MSNKKLIPIGDNVIVIPVEEELTTASGIIIPDSVSKEKPRKGKVMAVGSGKLLDNGNTQPIPVKEGDIIVFTQYAPTEIKVNNQEYYIVGGHSILAIEADA
ncbi:co-chaperone GroES [bacterium DOLZORAL124_38_8]|nr:MAG: co-chaperone GroES [bacterium DOLZORAL124_38_8]